MTTLQTAVSNSALQQPVYVAAQVGSTAPVWQASGAAMATQPQPTYGMPIGQPIVYLAAPAASNHQAAGAMTPNASYCVAPHHGQIQNQVPLPQQPQFYSATTAQQDQHYNNNIEKESNSGNPMAYSGVLSPAIARPFNNSAPPQLVHQGLNLLGQQSSSNISPMPQPQHFGQWSTEATSAEQIVPPQQKLIYAPAQHCYYVQQPAATAHYYPQHHPPPVYGNPAHLWPQHQQQPLGSWRQKRQAFGRSDRLRRLAETLSRKDAMPTFQLSDYAPHEKDNNTSASETSPSQMIEASSANNNHPAKLADDHVFEDDEVEGDEVDHHNQTVSELLSMLSGSGESSNKLKPSDLVKNDACSGSPVLAPSPVKLVEASTPAMSLNEQLQQDPAIMKASNHLNTPAKAKERVVQLPKPANFGGSSHKKAKGSPPPVILAEDEATDKMVYYDKSSCMHAPKATEVPII